tara:strand:+ start:500 stop:1438 length:939 start_codon:yes stop_codon:yes gene_type:complete
MENKVVKNMEYWKKKNNIPGIEALADSGLTDGRAGSSPFQIATPGSSPNKNFFKKALGFMNPLSGGPIGAGIRALAPNSQMAQGMTDPFGFQGGGGAGAMFGGMAGQPAIPQENPMAAVPVQTPMVMKSPMKQEDGDLVMVQADSFENPETGEMVVTENLQIDDDGHIPVINEEGMYYVIDNEGTKVPVSPDNESIVPKSVIAGIEPGRAMQEAIATYKSGGKQAMGGVGETPMEMRSALQHNDPKAKKKHDFRFDEPENQEAHEAWHKKNTPGFTESGDGERDFSKHNTNARETEGTIEEQKALQEANKPK